VNVAPTRPPIPATSQAKSKLKAFQFIPGAPQEPVEAHDRGAEHEGKSVEKAHRAIRREADVSSNMPEAISSAPQQVNKTAPTPQLASSEASKTPPQLPHANTFPSTPGMRLPLEELIGNIDENARRPEPEEQSPEEYVGWIPNSSSTLLTPNRTRRKRARSSSPSCPTTSSQRPEVSAFFTGNGAQTENKTPEADPAAVLWQRYASNKDSSDVGKLPDFNHLIFQASPRPLETPGKSGGLRRWASTGNDWPSSKSKRRKTSNKPRTSLWQDGQESEPGGKSKVAAMVEKIQESLTSQRLAQSTSKPAELVEGPSSSSPLPEVGMDKSSHIPTASPMQAHRQEPAMRHAQLRIHPAPAVKPLGAKSALALPASPIRHVPERQTNSTDSVISAPLHLQSKAPLPGYKRPAISRSSSGTGRQYPTKQPVAAPLPVVTEDLDEFGDAFDFSVEDLDELVSQVPVNQRPLHETPQHPNPPQQQPIVQDDDEAEYGDPNLLAQATTSLGIVAGSSDDDDFGDDEIDEASLAQAEITATQALRASNSSSNAAHRRSK